MNDLPRFAQEKHAVESLANEGWFTLVKWTVHQFRLAALGDIVVGGNRYAVRLVYGDQFPQVPAWVEPVDPNAKWSDHQYGAGGNLCLELRPDNWIPAATGADVLRSAYKLLKTENPLGIEHQAVDAAHNIGAIQSYGWSKEPVIVDGLCLLRIFEEKATGLRALRWSPDGTVWPIYLSDEEARAQGISPPAADPQTGRTEISVVVARGDVPEPPPKDRAALLSALGLQTESTVSDQALLVLTIGEPRLRPFHCMEDGSVYERKFAIIRDTAGARSNRTAAAGSKRVAIVGVGSLGSKIAESLIRSGVRHLLLIDGDIFLPGNLERHILDWRDVGFDKVRGVMRRLLNIAPAAEVKVIDDNLDWQRSPKTHAKQLDDLASCDLIIDATGKAAPSLFLGAIASENGRPFLSAEVYEGGLGALIARSIPGRDPPYAMGRDKYAAFCAEQNVQPPTSGEKDYEALLSSGTPVVADDAAVSTAAGHASRLALDILDDRIGSRDTAWLLLGFREGWLFKQHGENIMLDVGDAPQPPASEDESHAEVLEFAMSLAKEALNAAETSG